MKKAVGKIVITMRKTAEKVRYTNLSVMPDADRNANISKRVPKDAVRDIFHMNI